MILLRLLLSLLILKCNFCDAAKTLEAQIHALDVFNTKIDQLGKLKQVGNYETVGLNSSEAIQEDVAQAQGRNYVGVAIMVSRDTVCLPCNNDCVVTD